MRKKLVTIDEAIEELKRLDRELSKDCRMSAALTETLFCLRRMKEGLNLFGADANEAHFIATNFRGCSDYSEKRKKQLQLEQKYAMNKSIPWDQYDGIVLDEGEKEEGFWNS